VNWSVVTLSRDCRNLSRCFDFLTANERTFDRSRLIVVDDGALDDYHTREKLSGVTPIRGVKPFVFARNANLGLKYAFDQQSADVVILLNDDALLKTRRGFSKLAAVHHERRDSCGIIAATNNHCGNTRQYPARNPMPPYIRGEAEMLCFVCVSISREAWQRVGQLDERFVGYGYDDDDYSRRVLDAGLKLGIYDLCFVDHLTLHSTYRHAEYPTAGIEQNRKLYQEKYSAT